MDVTNACELCVYTMEDALQVLLLLRHGLGSCSSTSICCSLIQTIRREIYKSHSCRQLATYHLRQTRHKLLLLVMLATYVMV